MPPNVAEIRDARIYQHLAETIPYRQTLDAHAQRLFRNPSVDPGIPRLYRRFCELVSIPSPSGRENRVMDFIEKIVEHPSRDLKLQRDKVGNGLVEIPASPMLSDKPALVFQVHTDGVCSGSPDPAVYPITPVISQDGKWIESANRATTLRADNDIGVATLLSLLDDLDNIPHGRIAFLFTTREEESMKDGAGKLGFDLSNYSYLVNLDHESRVNKTEATNHTACSGTSTISFDAKRERIPDGKKLLRIKVKGLKGGHSGLDIGANRANGVSLLSQLLELTGTEKFNLVEINGGERPNSIPSQAEALIAVNDVNLEKGLKKVFSALQELSRQKYNDPGITFEVAKAKTNTRFMLDKPSTETVVNLLSNLPTGPKDIDKEGVVTSTNLGVVQTKGRKINIRMMTRSAEDELRDAYLTEIEELVKSCGANVETRKGYSRWKSDKDSALVRLVQRAHQKALGRKLPYVRVHAGTENSVLLTRPKVRHLIMTDIGLLLLDAHSTDEGVSIAAVEDFYPFCKQIVRETGTKYYSFQDVLEQARSKGEAETNGLDMRHTIEWYRQNKDILYHRLFEKILGSKKGILPQIENPELLHLSLDELAYLVGLFPRQAQLRCATSKIRGAKPLWFTKESTPQSPRASPKPDSRMSPTAIVPGYTNYAGWPRTGPALELPQIPPDATNDYEVVRLIQAEAVVHEYFHGITARLLYKDKKNTSYYLRLPNGKYVDGYWFIVNVFGMLAQLHHPVSNYSSFYRHPDNAFKFNQQGKITEGVGEEFCEVGTTYLLGYNSGSLVDLSKDPFADRPEMNLLFKDFLNAEVVTKKEAQRHLDKIIDPGELYDSYFDRAYPSLKS